MAVCMVSAYAQVAEAGVYCRLFNWMLHRIIDQMFNQVDYNNDGRLDPLEIEIAILHVYNVINKRLPGWQNPPTRKQIQTALTVFDVDGNGTLDKWVRFWPLGRAACIAECLI